MEKQLEDLGRAFEEFKKANDTRLNEIKTWGVASKATEEKVEKINAAISGLESKIEQMNAALSRSVANSNEVDPSKEAKEKMSQYKQACAQYMRKGVAVPQELMDFAKKSMSVDSDEDGGFLVSPEMSSEITKKIFESSPIRELASVQSISTDMLEMLHDLDEAGSGWVGEQQARPSTSTPQFKKEMIPVHELYANPQATQKLLDDAAINVEAWLSGKVTEKFARDEATAFISGNGVGKPKGILAYADGTGFGQVERKTLASTTVFTADELIDLQAKLKEAYQSNATWLMNRLTVAEVRKLKASDGHYLWQPGLANGEPATLLQRPVRHAADLTATGAANAERIIYGDIRAGYQVVDRIGIRVLRDAYTNKPFIGFYTTKRVGGAVKNFEAIKVAKQAAA